MSIELILKLALLVLIVVIVILLIVTTVKKCKVIAHKAVNNKNHKKYLEEKAKILRIQKQNALEETPQYYQQDYIPQAQEGEKIIGIAKPIGKWTQFVIKQKLGYLHTIKQFLAQQKNSGDNRKGFWQIMIESKASQGKQRGRSRGH